MYYTDRGARPIVGAGHVRSENDKKNFDSYLFFEIDVNLAKSAKVLTSGVQISVWRDARVKFSFDVEG